MKKILATLILLALLLGCAAAEDTGQQGGVVVLYTNDVHCGIDDYIGYAGLAAYEAAYEALGYDVLLADVGDAVQGGPVGTLSKGEYIIDIMNELGYDVATIGNHEFDYGMDQFMALREQANFPYVAANFCDMNGEPALDGYVILQAGGCEIAFVGVATPETFTKSTPTYFMDDQGNFIYNFAQGDEGRNLYAAVQTAVDAARDEGADYVVLLSHLGIDAASSPYTSSELIVNISGVDVVLDGHSHSVIEGDVVIAADGSEVLLSSTGTKLERVGALIIEADGSISTRLHTESIFQDEDAQAYIASVKAQYEESLNQVVAHSDVDLCVNDPATGERMVRSCETNLGDLCADAYRAMTGSDIAMVNGGGIRADIAAGDITYGEILNVHPFGNMMCMVEASGQDILDALEVGVMGLPGEDGSLQHVSGMSYEINTAIPTSVVLDDEGMFQGVEGERRISNVLVGGEPIDPEKIYTLTSHNYMIKLAGGGFNMFQDNALLLDEVMLDNQVLMNYIVDVLGGVVGEEYADPYGQGRITIR